MRIFKNVLLTVVATGAIAMTAPAAHAATVTQWDRVARCESGGNWRINTGNGYYGGLQISHSTWKSYGGLKYAYNAHKTSKANQIVIANKILRGQGKGAWGSCGRAL
jgi:hypothetical protein